jgi:hypothetical protein
MSINIPQLANPKALVSKPANATAVALYVATSNLRGILNSISVCNPTAAGDVFSVSLLSPAAVTYDIYREKPIAAKETFVLAEHEVPIFDGWSLMVKQGAAAASLHFVAVVGEISSVRGS